MFARRAGLLSRGYRYLAAPNQHPQTFSSLSSRAFAAVNAAMADTANTSGITADGLKQKLAAQLEAPHVEVEDISGMVYYNRFAAFRDREERKKRLIAN